MSDTYTSRIKDQTIKWGATLVGVSDVLPLRGLRTYPPDLLDPFVSALSIAVALPVWIFEMISDRPTATYKSAYETANRILDDIAFRTTLLLESDGFCSLPIPASQIVDKENLCGAITHKAVARMAGLGWQGKNLLLITPQHGSRVRLATVLTKAPLVADEPLENRCGNCTLCRDACPVGAIRGVNTKSHYGSRDEAMYFSRCADQLMEKFAAMPDIGTPICGICIKVCPFGRKKKGNRTSSRPAQ
ncbi:MAG: 4Fe-4S double cluster binding domain-containing protein [Thermodesulfobacteriota bacterium]|nr:4Fe-4S double cluster binding domain-containing protein [Thermodesulfobacteriota bacterium]